MQLSGKSKPQSGNPALVNELRNEIAAGPMTFARFMELALYHPEHGYYRSGKARIGRAGDYFTSVSVGPLFGRMLAAQFVEIREQLGSPNDFTIVEQGAHGGEFARDVLVAAPELRYQALERGQTLPTFEGVHFSNELIDSFPVHLVKWTGTEWLERRVVAPDELFEFLDLPISDPRLRERVERIPLPLPAGYETEVNLAALDWIETVASKLTRGFIIAVDYGFPRDEFYAPHRTRGTLQTYVKHRPNESPLLGVGEADMTAHVEWTSLVEHAMRCGLALAGFTDQHHFLTGLLTDEIAHDASATRALQTLLQPSFLGMKFQFLVLAKNLNEPPHLRGLRFARDARSALGLSRE
ncbi:MAG TPA: SAM-dependent methyltransferase [Chthoniobacterales bacterium]